MWNVFATESGEKINQREAALLSLAFVFLCLVSVALTLASAARVQDWNAFPDTLDHLILLPVWALAAWLLHREAGRVVPKRDPYLLPLAMLLIGWGNLVIWRLNPGFGLRQTLWFGLACLLVLGLFRFDPSVRWLRDYRYLWMLLALTLLGLTLIFGTNPLGGEPRLWLGCCGVYFQPSEPLRFFLVAFLASYLGERLRLSEATKNELRWRDLLPLFLVWGISILLLVVQRDLGTGMLFLALLASLLYLAIGAWQVLAVTGTLAVGGGILSYHMFEVVQVRVQAWLNPWLDPTGQSYQIVQSLISIASGGIVGRGPGLGSPGFVPASHTDFIYTAITEEFGLVGAVALLTIFAIFVSRGLKIGSRHPDGFARFLATGLTLAIGLQAIFIIGGVMRALPLVGITLPFVSYGGSSLLTSFAALSILMLLSGAEARKTNQKQAYNLIHAGFSAVWVGLALITAWWTIYRAPTLIARSDNPRRSLDSRFVERGMIMDRNGLILARSDGEPGSYEREYSYPSAAPFLGFDSMIYGQSGLESSMDGVLRGLERGSYIENAYQRLISSHPPQGENLTLTIDVQLQAIAMELLAERSGAAVLLEAQSGELYVIASQPSYDPNQIEESWVELVSDDDAPLFNRATQGLYQPGMTIAPYLFTQAYADGDLSPGQHAAGLSESVRVGEESVYCSLAPPADAEKTLEMALRFGCPQPVQKTFTTLGWESMKTALESFGFDQPVGINLDAADPQALIGVPSESELEQLAIGQGSLRVSPVQMARSFGGLFAEGQRAPLKLVLAVDEDGEGWVERESVGYRVPPLSGTVLETVKQIYAVGVTDLYDLRAQAVSGAEGESLGWYLAALEDQDSLWVVVIVLEDGAPYEAEGIGKQILAAAQTLSP